MNTYDFGYTWPWTYGHLVVTLILATLVVLLWKHAPKWISTILAALALWAFAGFLIVQLMFGFNRTMTLPTATFLASGAGKVLDIGAGSGRATIMVGQVRPQVRLVALDNFSAQYIQGNGPELLHRNLRIAGIDDRTEILSADMRQIPAPDASFDGVVSTYAIDHLNGEGIRKTLREVNRVLKPQGDFLLAVMHGDRWMAIAFGPMAIHHHLRDSANWHRLLDEAGFQIVEEGTTPGSLHFLCRRKTA